MGLDSFSGINLGRDPKKIVNYWDTQLLKSMTSLATFRENL